MVTIINISGSAVALIIQLIIGVFTMSKMRAAKVTGYAKRLFILSWTLSLLTTIEGIFLSLHGNKNTEHSGFVNGLAGLTFGVFWFFVLLTLQGTLVVRLYVTFHQTALGLTKNAVFSFTSLFVFDIILCILYSVAYVLHLIHGDAYFLWIYLGCDIIFASMYIATSAVAVRLFVVYLSKLIRSDDPSDNNGNAINSLNHRQQKLVHLSARYILLFVFASMFTILSEFLWFVVCPAFGGVYFPIDFCVNLWCLCLQFGFAEKHYRKCCGCLDSLCVAMVSDRAKRKIYREKAIKRQHDSIGSDETSGL